MQLKCLVEDTRAMAKKAADPAAKKALITVAEAYEAMLQRAEGKNAGACRPADAAEPG
jgi:hypothetical protein